ncbi:acetyl-CoA carboxylase biotin carboxyl carrier protein subunit [Helicobacter sp. 13S00401-1]|uniref:acetyl-CoA carboxylase n=1 Tax=Helicobacter sp. 13S00401-1 TaxID=1905758 RepID=UPI000BA5E0C4|nr:acetyl-CoA carboxylase [Helicobacter sp. 13S00401-1]PAF50397.1 acetyl-CoA carboxylase biotin carboxyl carrier protein subunit [Helicobacter sp. 13S00401-1]
MLEIISPIPGTFYRKPSPTEAEFVSVGSVVTPDTVVALVEVMKTFIEIKAECSGKIVEVLAQSEAVVEAGSVLFRVEE